MADAANGVSQPLSGGLLARYSTTAAPRSRRVLGFRRIHRHMFALPVQHVVDCPYDLFIRPKRWMAAVPRPLLTQLVFRETRVERAARISFQIAENRMPVRPRSHYGMHVVGSYVSRQEAPTAILARCRERQARPQDQLSPHPAVGPAGRSSTLSRRALVRDGPASWRCREHTAGSSWRPARQSLVPSSASNTAARGEPRANYRQGFADIFRLRRRHPTAACDDPCQLLAQRRASHSRLARDATGYEERCAGGRRNLARRRAGGSRSKRT